jgi:transposase
MEWVFGTGSSWRDLPEEEFGPWREVYGRYPEWRKEGHWQRMIEALRHCRYVRLLAEIEVSLSD